MHVLSADCQASAADGEYYVELGISGNHRIFDMASLALSHPLTEGMSYTLSYSYKRGNRSARTNYLQIGLAQDSSLGSFGQQIYEKKGAEMKWERETFQFVAPKSGRFITLKLKVGTGARIQLDDFELACPSELELGVDTSYCVVQDIVLQARGNFEQYYWQDGSTNARFIVDEPGVYSLRATRDNCVLTDSIRIDEIEYNCACQFYAPNAFSPNRDGRNDVFLPLSPCALQFFDLQIFGRWGQLVYRSQDHRQGWDGVNGFDYYPAGQYLYLLRYQFTYQEETVQKTGSFLLIR